MKLELEVEVTCSESSAYALACVCNGAAYHVWLDRNTRALEKPVLYKNSLAKSRTDVGYFNTRKLSTESAFGAELVRRMLEIATRDRLFEKAEETVKLKRSGRDRRHRTNACGRTTQTGRARAARGLPGCAHGDYRTLRLP